MKRIYLLMILFVAFAGKAWAQPTDLEVLTSLKSVDSISWSTKGHYGKIIVYGFTNHGPKTLMPATDTLLLAKGYYKGGQNRYKFIVPAAGFKPMDTLYPVGANNQIKPDTVIFTSAPSSNPYNWCDTINYYTGALNIQTDSKPSNNSKCSSVTFKQKDNLSINEVNGNKDFMVYPNPAFRSISFSHNYDGSDVKTFVKDMTGKTVHYSTIKELYGQKEVHIDISSFAAGMYVLEVYANGEKMTAKFTVAK